jgi:hypothetical protein
VIEGELEMLTDHRSQQQQIAEAASRKRQLHVPMGGLFEDMAEWDWYVTVTFSDSLITSETLATRGRWINLRQIGPGTDFMARQIKNFFDDLQTAAGGSMGAVWIADFGEVSGRFHAHALVSGVRTLSINAWEAQARTRFGVRSTIVPYIKEGGAAQYLGKHALSDRCQMFWEGCLASVAPATTTPVKPVGRVVVAPSAPTPTSRLFRMGRRNGKVR